MNKHDVIVEADLIEALALACDYRDIITDVRKCQETGCDLPGLVCKSAAVTQYLCVEHNQQHGFCSSCGEFVQHYLDLLDQNQEVLCNRCAHLPPSGDDELPSTTNVFGPDVQD